MTKSLYDTLGIPNYSTAEEIRKAYKDKAKKLHPDKGGDKDEFTEVNKAYVVLIDPAKRERYDKTGQTQDVPFEMKFAELVNHVFMRLVEMEDEKTSDLVTLFKKQCFLHKREMDKKRGEFDRKLAKFMGVLDRLKGGGQIRLVLEGSIEDARRNILMIKKEIEFLDKAMEVIDTYKYETDDLPQPNFVTSWYITNG